MASWILPVALACFLVGVSQSCAPGGTAPSNVVCTDIIGDINFDLKKFSGEWNVVFTSNQTEAATTKCAKINFAELNEGFQALHTSLITETSKASILANKYKQDAAKKYKFQHSTASACGFKDSGFPVETIITDYETYALVYSCVMKDKAISEHGVLLSRTSTLSDEIKNKTTAGIRTPLYPIPQEGCTC